MRIIYRSKLDSDNMVLHAVERSEERCHRWVEMSDDDIRLLGSAKALQQQFPDQPISCILVDNELILPLIDLNEETSYGREQIVKAFVAGQVDIRNKVEAVLNRCYADLNEVFKSIPVPSSDIDRV